MTAVFRPLPERVPDAGWPDELKSVFADCDLVLVEGQSQSSEVKLEVWRADQINQVIEGKLVLATQKTYRLTDRLSSDPYYLAGFAVGVEEAKSLELDSCSELVAVDLEKLPGRTTPSNTTGDLGRERNQRGFNDGKL